jgi:hypothetical protein
VDYLIKKGTKLPTNHKIHTESYHSAAVHHVVKILVRVGTEVHTGCHAREGSTFFLANAAHAGHIFKVGLKNTSQ